MIRRVFFFRYEGIDGSFYPMQIMKSLPHHPCCDPRNYILPWIFWVFFLSNGTLKYLIFLFILIPFGLLKLNNRCALKVVAQCIFKKKKPNPLTAVFWPIFLWGFLFLSLFFKNKNELHFHKKKSKFKKYLAVKLQNIFLSAYLLC